jgi:hypothetical protein
VVLQPLKFIKNKKEERKEIKGKKRKERNRIKWLILHVKRNLYVGIPYSTILHAFQ